MTGRLSIRTPLSVLPGKRRLMGARSCSSYVDSKELKAEFIRNERQKKKECSQHCFVRTDENE